MKESLLEIAGFLSGWACIYVILATITSLWKDYGPLESIVEGSSYLISIGIAVVFASLTIYFFEKSK